MTFYQLYEISVTLLHCREAVQQKGANIESMKSQLHVAETNHKLCEALASERAHQIATLEQEVKVRDERLAGVEEVRGTRETQIIEMESKLATSTDKVAQLLVDKERLSQQVRMV